jgi:hypothetical protein
MGEKWKAEERGTCTHSTLAEESSWPFLLWFLEYTRLTAQLTATTTRGHTVDSDIPCETLYCSVHVLCGLPFALDNFSVIMIHGIPMRNMMLYCSSSQRDTNTMD